jgi:hypothetical protein
MRHRLDDHRIRVAATPHAAAGARVLDAGAAVPDEPPDIGLVAQYAIATLRLAPDRRVVPDAAARSRNTLLVQRAENVPGALPGRVALEDTADDGGLNRVNLAQAAVDLAGVGQLADDPVAIGRGAEAAALPNAAF